MNIKNQLNLTGVYRNRINETETSGSVSEAAPENARKIIDIGYNGEEKQLTESDQLLQLSQNEIPLRESTASNIRKKFESGEIDMYEAIDKLVMIFDLDPDRAIDYLSGNKIDFGLDNEIDTLDERIKLRKEFNKHLTEAIEQGKVEEINNSEKPLGRCRYQLQKFINGGTPYVDEEGTPRTDGEVGGPSSYEKWRFEMNDKKRQKRLEQERDDANSPWHSPRITQADPEGTLDNQIDQFLAQFVKEHGGEPGSSF